MQALLGNQRAAVKALTISLRHRPATERRSRAITTARLAELHLTGGQLDQAIITWQAFLDDYPHLCSARASKALTHMHERLRPTPGTRPPGNSSPTPPHYAPFPTTNDRQAPRPGTGADGPAADRNRPDPGNSRAAEKAHPKG